MLPGRPWHRCRRARWGADDRARGLGLSADCQPRMRGGPVHQRNYWTSRRPRA